MSDETKDPKGPEAAIPADREERAGAGDDRQTPPQRSVAAPPEPVDRKPLLEAEAEADDAGRRKEDPLHVSPTRKPQESGDEDAETTRKPEAHGGSPVDSDQANEKSSEETEGNEPVGTGSASTYDGKRPPRFDPRRADTTVDEDRLQEQRAVVPQRLGEAVLQRVEHFLTDPPPSVREGLEKCYVRDVLAPQDRVFLIHGAQGTGRFSCAVWLGLEILKRRGSRALYFAPELTIDRLTLYSVAASALKLDDGSVYIVPNVFERGLRYESLASEYVASVQEQLEQSKKEVYVVLTGTTDKRESFHNVDRLVSLPTRSPESPEYIAKTIRRYLDAYTDASDPVTSSNVVDREIAVFIEEIESDGNQKEIKLRDLLSTPSQVDQFFTELVQYRGVRSRHSEESEDEYKQFAKSQLFELARRINPDDAHRVKRWFEKLKPNAKLYALLASVFEGIHTDHRLVHDLFTEVVAHLRQDGVKVHDPREDSLGQLFEQIRVELTDNRLEFSADLYRKEVQQQVENYRHLLWTAAPIFTDWIMKNPRRSDRDFRVMLGYVLGRLGVHNWFELTAVLAEFAAHDQGYVAEIPAFALRAVVNECGPYGERGRLIETVRLLRSWLAAAEDPKHRERRHYLVWSSLVAAWHVYDALAYKLPSSAGDAAIGKSQSDKGRDDHATYVGDNGRAAATSETDAFEPERKAQLEVEKVLRQAVLYIVRRSCEIELADEDDAHEIHWVYTLFHGLKQAVLEIFQQWPNEAVDLLRRWMLGEAAEEDDRLSANENLSASTDEQAGDERRATRPEDSHRNADGHQRNNEESNRGNGDDQDEEDDDDDDDDDQEDHQRQRAEYNREQAEREMLKNFGAAIADHLISRFRDPELLMERTHGPLLRLVTPLLHLSADDLDESRSFDEQYGAAQVAIDDLMFVLQGWLEKDKWTQRVYTVLLQALNRSRVGPRGRMCRNLSNHWLQHSDPLIRRIGQTLMGRALIIDGAPVDAPGGHQGLLVIDATDDARVSNTAQQTGFQLYGLLRSLTDLTVGYLGRHTWVACPGRDASFQAFRLDRSSPRLVAPLLEKMVPEKTSYALLLIWGLPIDWDDLSTSPFEAWRGRLLGMSAEPQLPEFEELDLVAPVFRRFNQFTSERSRTRICDHVNRVLRRELSQRTAEQWKEFMTPHLADETLHSAVALRAHLNALSQQLDDTPEQGADIARVIGCGVQYLASLDMNQAVDLLAEWMQAGSDAPQPPLGLSYATMLLQILLARPVPTKNAGESHDNVTKDHKKKRLRLPTPEELNPEIKRKVAQVKKKPAPPLPSVETHGPLLRMATMFAEKSYGYGLLFVLEWVRRWIHDDRWSKLFIGTSEEAELYQMVERAPDVWREGLIRQFQAWGRPRDERGEERAPEAALKLGRILTEHLLIGHRKRQPEDWSDDDAVFVVLLDPGGALDESRSYLGDVARRVHSYYRSGRSRYRGLQVLTYRLGELSPAALPDEKPTADGLLPLHLGTRIPLMAPILESLPQRLVRGVLLLGNRLPLDAEDVMGDWKVLGKWCYHGQQLAEDAMWEMISHRRKPKDTVAEIVRRFEPILKGAADEEDE